MAADATFSRSDEESVLEYTVLQFARLGGPVVNIGVLVYDSRGDKLFIRLLEDWSGFDPEEMEILADLAEDLHAKAVERGPSALLAYLEDTLSNSLRMTDRQTLPTSASVNDDVVEAIFCREVLR